MRRDENKCLHYLSTNSAGSEAAHLSRARIKKGPKSGQSLRADLPAKENAPYEMESLKSFTVCQKRLTEKYSPHRSMGSIGVRIHDIHEEEMGMWV